jgi:hypothetical protein
MIFVKKSAKSHRSEITLHFAECYKITSLNILLAMIPLRSQ